MAPVSLPVVRISIHLTRIRIQHFMLNTDPDLDPIRIQGFDDQKLEKIYSLKNSIFLIKNYNLPITRPLERTSKLQKKPSAFKREHPALQNMKFLNFFLHLWVILPSWIWIRIQSG
jgi:hypothetical protein